MRGASAGVQEQGLPQEVERGGGRERRQLSGAAGRGVRRGPLPRRRGGRVRGRAPLAAGGAHGRRRRLQDGSQATVRRRPGTNLLVNT